MSGTGGKSTIYDIATATGTSPSTVSMVLNGTWQRYRIKEDTARRVLEAANGLGYAVNMKARALRLSRSGLAGMIIPHYRNRFFAGLSETFEAGARARNLCPIVVSTQRDVSIETHVVETLLSQQVEFLFITGATRPDPLNALCRAAGVPCVNLDLPGSGAPSVVSDNRAGARSLTELLLSRIQEAAGDPAEMYFVGGLADEFATEGRIAGFRDAFAGRGLPLGADAVQTCGYGPPAARDAAAAIFKRLGRRLPAGLFVNSITAFEGVVQFLQSLRGVPLDQFIIGCFDWDPFAHFLPFPVAMMRQDIDAIMEAAFEQVERADDADTPLIRIPPRLVPDWRQPGALAAASTDYAGVGK